MTHCGTAGDDIMGMMMIERGTASDDGAGWMMIMRQKTG